MICFNIVHANTKSSMMLRQSICTQSSFICTHYSRHNGSNALFSRRPSFSTTLTTLTSQLPVNSSSSLSSPLSFLIAPPRTCSATVHGHCYVGLFSAYISMDHSAHWSFQILLVCRHLGFLSTLFMVHPIFLRQPVHDTIRLSKSIFCFISEIAHVLFYIILWIHVWSIL